MTRLLSSLSPRPWGQFTAKAVCGACTGSHAAEINPDASLNRRQNDRGGQEGSAAAGGDPLCRGGRRRDERGGAAAVVEKLEGLGLGHLEA